MNIKVAYLLLAHKNVEQVNIFIGQLLENGDCDVYVHVDIKSKESFKGIINSPNVFTCSVYDVRWGSFEIVKAALKLMKLATESGRQYTHVYFGSGQDLMVKRGFYHFLQQKPETIFLHIVGEINNTDRESARYRVKWNKKLMVRNDLHPYRFIRIIIQILCKFGFVINKNNSEVDESIRFYEGRTWFIIPWDVMIYILNYVDQNKSYIEFWKDSLASDLMFFQTIIMNSKYSDKVEDELMYVNFGKTFKTMNHPISVTKNDITAIEHGVFFFARKFEYDDFDSIKFYLNRMKG